MTRFIVLTTRQTEGTSPQVNAWGPYRDFMTADKDARAWDGVDGYTAITLPVEDPDLHYIPTQGGR